MADRVVTVGDNLTLPASVKVADGNLPTRLGTASLNATIASQSTSAFTDPSSTPRKEAARTFARGISLTQPEFGAVLASPATHQGALDAALAAANAAKTTLHIPSGSWLADNLNLTTLAALKGDGHRQSKIRRVRDFPVIKMQGQAYSGTGAFFPSIYGVTVEDLCIGSENLTAVSPLVGLYGAAGNFFNRVLIESYSDGAPLLETAQLWDSKFNGCMFHGGGSDVTGLGAVRLMSGLQVGGQTYRQTKETFFTDCWWESYYGPAIEAGRPAGYVATKTEMMHFANIKMESNLTHQAHVRFDVASHIRMRNFYMTHKYTSGPIMDLVEARGIEGSVGFVRIQAADSVVPTEELRIRAASYLVDLDVTMAEPQASTDNLVTIDTPLEPTIKIRTNAPHPRINGATIRNKVQMGAYWLWLDSVGVMRRKQGVPLSDFDGQPITQRNVSSASLLDATNAVNTSGKYQGLQVYCTSVAKFLHTNGATATSPWLNPDATVAFTPV